MNVEHHLSLSVVVTYRTLKAKTRPGNRHKDKIHVIPAYSCLLYGGPYIYIIVPIMISHQSSDNRTLEATTWLLAVISVKSDSILLHPGANEVLDPLQ